MKNLVIASTKKTPEIIFRTTGDLMITGSSLPGDVHKFYNPILLWLEELKAKKPKKITITFELEHVNTSGTRMVLQILRTLNSIKEEKNYLTIIWKYDYDDSDMLEQGEALEEILQHPFIFEETEND